MGIGCFITSLSPEWEEVWSIFEDARVEFRVSVAGAEMAPLGFLDGLVAVDLTEEGDGSLENEVF